jgi:O-antigen ligase
VTGLGGVLIGVYAAVAVAGEALPGFGVPVTKIAAAAFVIEALVARSRVGWSGLPPLSASLRFFGALGLLAAASLLWSTDPESTRRLVRHLGQEAVLLSALLIHPRSGAVLRSAAFGAVLGAAVLGLQLVGVLISPDDLRGVRISVGEGEPGVQGRAAATGLVLGLAAITPTAGPRVHWATEGVLLVAVVFAGLGVGVTGSRGAWFAALVAVGLALVLARTFCERRMAVVGLTMILVGIVALTLRPDARGPMPGVLDGDVEAMTSGRDAIWRNAGSVFLESPVLGAGGAAVAFAAEPHRKALEASGGPTSKPLRDAHSVYLEVGAGLGVVGLLLLLLGLISAARGVAQARDFAGPALALVVLSGLTLTTWEHTTWWLALGWVAVAVQLPSRRTASSSGPSETSGA